jgi:hypothetical protein
MIFERVEVSGKETSAELLGRVPGHLDELVAGLYPNGVDSLRLHRGEPTHRAESEGPGGEPNALRASGMVYGGATNPMRPSSANRRVDVEIDGQQS